MNNFDKIYNELYLIDTFYKFFVRLIKLFFLFIFIIILYNFIKNRLPNNDIIYNKKTVILNPTIQTNGNSKYILTSKKGFVIDGNIYRFEDVKISNNNINIFTKKLDFYNDKNEINMSDRPIIIFNNNRE